MVLHIRFSLAVAVAALALAGCGSGVSSRTVIVPTEKLVREIRKHHPKAERIHCDGKYVVHESGSRVSTSAPTCTWYEDGHPRAGTP